MPLIGAWYWLVATTTDSNQKKDQLSWYVHLSTKYFSYLANSNYDLYKFYNQGFQKGLLLFFFLVYNLKSAAQTTIYLQIHIHTIHPAACTVLQISDRNETSQYVQKYLLLWSCLWIKLGVLLIMNFSLFCSN